MKRKTNNKQTRQVFQGFEARAYGYEAKRQFKKAAEAAAKKESSIIGKIKKSAKNLISKFRQVKKIGVM